MTKESVAAIIFLFIVVTVLAFTNPPDDIGAPEDSTVPGHGTGLDPQTSLLKIHVAIFCDDEDRDSVDGADPRGVIYNYYLYHDGTEIFDSETQYLTSEPFMWSHNPPSFKFRWDLEPNAGIPDAQETNPKYIRFEGLDDVGGGCYTYGMANHEYYIDGEFEKAYNSGWKRISPTNFSYFVDWDTNQAQCEGIGGAWLSGGDYDGFRCCGDDWIWINNLALDYQPRDEWSRIPLVNADELCLYSKNEGADFGGFIDTEEYFGANSYICDYQAMDHQAYDPKLEYDDFGEGETTFGRANKEYHFLDDLQTETDIGKWSDNNQQNPMFCDMEFNPATGVKFKWKTIEDEASTQLGCEIYLGYNWTGTKCCGAPNVDISYSDPEPECNARDRASELLQISPRMSRATFRAEFDDLCEIKTRNTACYLGHAIENNSIVPEDPDNTSVQNILNVNGNLLVCGPAIISPLETVGKCEIRGSDQEFSICTYSNDSWINHNDAAPQLAYVDTNPLTGQRYTLEELQDVVHESTVPTEVPASARADFARDFECCFSGCWDGTQCVENFVAYEIYNNEWRQFTGTLESNKSVYMCVDGEWKDSSDAEYNWFHDTDKPWFCLADDTCVCEPGSDGCPEQYIDYGCTNIPNFQYHDHFCEEDGWTSRTKLLAAQLMELAPDKDHYSLFCDKYNKSINYFEPIQVAPENINSICALGTGDSVILGVSFNSDNPADFDTASLFDIATGFISVALEETDVVNCNYAVENADSTAYGTFKRCMISDSRYYYNNRTQSLIFSVNPISAQDTLPSNYPANNDEIQGYFSKISDYIAANADSINAHDRIMNIEIFRNAQSFNRMYIGKNGQEIVFGTIEKLYDGELRLKRNFMGVVYQGLNIDCGLITEADSNAWCGSASGDTFVLYRNEADNFPYWTDLTAKLRFS